MASPILPLCTSKTLTPVPSSSNNSSLFFPKPSQLFLHGKRCQSFKVSCKANNNGEHDKNLEPNNNNNGGGNVDRRNVILGLGGLYGAANLAPLANASTVKVPASCGTAFIDETTVPPVEVPYSCCPPDLEELKKAPYYMFPSMPKLRIRPPAHDVDEEYEAKYKLAMSRMKALDKDPFDPINFTQQAHVHCAYCNGAYKAADGKTTIQVHFSWLFFPFHRWQLYFYERILGSLIDDPTFALPYWNWDHPKGMRIPPMFDQEGSPLYDEKRDQRHRNGKIMDLGYFGDEVQTTELQQMTNNLTLMYRQMVTNAPCPSLFFGAPNPDAEQGMGTIENIPHTPVHIWVGDSPRQRHGENLGNFYSAGLDPLFYCHHANVDRMWNEWKALGGKRRDLTDKDWRNSEFYFYDENRNPYKVKVKDCLDSKKMGYDYEPMPTPWRNFKPKRKATKGKVNLTSVKEATKVFPLSKLDRAVTFSIERPASGRTQEEKDDQMEMLTFNNIMYDDSKYVRFDVFVNADKTVNADELDKVEYAGSYTNLPHIHAKNAPEQKMPPKVFQLAITELLEDIGLEDEKIIAITLVPKRGGEEVSVGGATIELADC